MKFNTITKQQAETVPGGVYEGIDYHGEPPADVAARAGWVDMPPEIQAQIDADAAAAEQAAQAERDAWRALKDAVQAIDPAKIDKTPFADAAQKATVQAIKDSVKAIKDALRRVMDMERP